MGHHRFYNLAMQWNMEVMQTYKDVPFFVYSHFEAAHAGPPGLVHMDAALRDHLVHVMDAHPSAVIALTADHGLRATTCDQKTPILHVLAPRELLEARPDIAAALRNNQDQVVSPWDLFATFTHLP